jgi:hypothetical protein
VAVDVKIDVELLKSEIRKTYAAVSQQPETDFIFPTGRAWAADLDYPLDLLANVPESAAESFAGVANPFSLGRLKAGERVLDLGCGAGTDSLVAAQMVGPEGHVTGIDMTPEMLAKARASADAMGIEERRVRRGRGGEALVPRRELRRRHLERRHRPDPGQGRGLLRALPRARPRRARADRGRDDPAAGERGRPPQHRPLDRLNCRGSAGGRVRQAVREARLRADRGGQPRRHLRPLEVRGHAQQGDQIRRPGRHAQGLQTTEVSNACDQRPEARRSGAGRAREAGGRDAALGVHRRAGDGLRLLNAISRRRSSRRRASSRRLL